MRITRAEFDGRTTNAGMAAGAAVLERPISNDVAKERRRRVDTSLATGRRPAMLSSLETLRDDLPMRSLLTEYRHQHFQKPEVEWHHRVMALPRVEPERMSRLHGYLLASGWIDTRVELTSFSAAGEVLSSYRITREGTTALHAIEQDGDAGF